jgi:hypothetical protein
MIVVIQYKESKNIEEYHDVYNFWFNTTRFYIKFANGNSKSISRRHAKLVRIHEVEHIFFDIKKEKKKDTLHINNREMHILWRALLYYWENKDFSDEPELRHNVNVLREKVSDFMTGEIN